MDLCSRCADRDGAGSGVSGMEGDGQRAVNTPQRHCREGKGPGTLRTNFLSPVARPSCLAGAPSQSLWLKWAGALVFLKAPRGVARGGADSHAEPGLNESVSRADTVLKLGCTRDSRGLLTLGCCSQASDQSNQSLGGPRDENRSKAPR